MLSRTLLIKIEFFHERRISRRVFNYNNNNNNNSSHETRKKERDMHLHVLEK